MRRLSKLPMRGSISERVRSRVQANWANVLRVKRSRIDATHKEVVYAAAVFAQPEIRTAGIGKIRDELKRRTKFRWIEQASPELWRALGRFAGSFWASQGYKPNPEDSKIPKIVQEMMSQPFSYGLSRILIAGPGMVGINWMDSWSLSSHTLVMVDNNPFIASLLEEYRDLSGKPNFEIVEADLRTYRPLQPFHIQVWSLVLSYCPAAERAPFYAQIKQMGSPQDLLLVFETLVSEYTGERDLFATYQRELRGNDFKIDGAGTFPGNNSFYIIATLPSR